MSVLIKGMKMPKCCDACPMFFEYRFCSLTDDHASSIEWKTEEKRMPNCPLIELPSAEKKGKIIESEETNSGGLMRMVCSECGKVIYSTYGYRIADIRFCPYCGADVRGE